jgi:uncharacterized protein (TIGR01777 family)
MKPNKFSARLLFKSEKDAGYLWHLKKVCFSRSLPSWERGSVLSVEELEGRQVRLTVLYQRSFCKVRAVFRIHYPIGSQLIRIKEEAGSFKTLDFHIEIKSLGENLYELIERVEYNLAWPKIFPNLRKEKFEKRLQRFFDYKHEIMLQDLVDLKQGVKPLKILVSGSNGLIGSGLCEFLEVLGHRVYRLVRSKSEVKSAFDILYHIEGGEVNRSDLEGFDAVVHLWGKSIQSSWSGKNKREILDSRVEVTKQLSKILASLQKPPKAFLCASAIGYYGDHGNQEIDETTPSSGDLFLSEVCKAWESASDFLKVHGIRVVHLRFGVVLSSKKGALYEVVKMIRRGVGGILGSGNQFISWIAIDDAVRAIYHAILTESLNGALNITSPAPLTNKDFNQKISKYLKKPLGPSIPAVILKLLKGEMAEELILSSAKVYPKKLLESGYQFKYPNLEDALPHLIY